MRLRIPHGFLLVVEGIDGAGKSTQARRLAEGLGRRFEVELSREPTQGPFGRRIRESMAGERMAPAEELRCFVEDRREHVAQVVLPALARGKIVVLDRYYFSTAAYQGARGFDAGAILEENEAFAPPPDLLLLLDVNPKLGRARISGRGDVANSFEQEEELGRVRSIFGGIERPYLRRVDASGPEEEVWRRIDLEAKAAILSKALASDGVSDADLAAVARGLFPPGERG